MFIFRDQLEEVRADYMSCVYVQPMLVIGSKRLTRVLTWKSSLLDNRVCPR